MKPVLGFKSNSWIWYVSMLAVVLGMLLAAALKAQQTIRTHSGIPTTRVPGLARAYLDEKERNQRLQQEVVTIHQKSRELEEAIGQGTAGSELLRKELDRARFMAGMIPVVGPGLTVTLRDSKRLPPPDADADLRDQYIIHDYDIRNFVNELLNNGAEAVAVNDQRITSLTAIRCVGAPILINDIKVQPPYRVAAIGPPETMVAGLKMPGGVMDLFRLLADVTDMVHIETSKEIRIPAYMGAMEFKYATVDKMETEEKQ